MENTELGIYLSKLRTESGFKSQRKLAEVSGVSSATISRIESGAQKPQPETLKALAPYFKSVTYEELLEKAGYIEKRSSYVVDTDKLANDIKLAYNPIDEVKKYGIEDMGFFDIEEWKNLGPDDIRLLEEQFKLIVKLAKERNKDK